MYGRYCVWYDSVFVAHPLKASIARLVPYQRILEISVERGLGNPLVSALNGTWVSRQQGLWVEAYLEYMRQPGIIGPQPDPALDVYAAREPAMLIEDINRVPPSVILWEI